MSVPKSVTRVKKDGVEFVSNVDAVQYTLRELTRGALRDVGKFLRKRYEQNYDRMTKRKISKLGRVHADYWARKYECDLQFGMGKRKAKKATKRDIGRWAEDLEIGSSQRPKIPILRTTVFDNIPMIIEIESKYLSELNKEKPNLSGLSEDDYEGD
jgi:hypothetical protein